MDQVERRDRALVIPHDPESESLALPWQQGSGVRGEAEASVGDSQPEETGWPLVRRRFGGIRRSRILLPSW